MKLKDAWKLVCSADCYIFIDGEFFAGGDVVEVEKTVEETGLWTLDVEGFSTFNGYLKIIAYHPEA